MLVEKKILSDHFEEIYVSWFSRMKYFALEYVVSEEDAENIVQDVFTELWERKEILAYELTKLVHGEEEAEKAKQAAEALFGGGGAMTDVPTVNLTAEQANAKLIDVLTAAKVFSSKREARQMVQQGGLYIGDTAVSDAEMQLSPEMFDADKSLLVRKGKKKYYRLLID